ncbi:MAG TPA: esterase-like activity of phytase family protein [Pseudobdellovibrionaceae bacterium]|nr:esterase-like activity of phytase family protein [Pseudobdellovibrionaceae bacterium]
MDFKFSKRLRSFVTLSLCALLLASCNSNLGSPTGTPDTNSKNQLDDQAQTKTNSVDKTRPLKDSPSEKQDEDNQKLNSPKSAEQKANSASKIHRSANEPFLAPGFPGVDDQTNSSPALSNSRFEFRLISQQYFRAQNPQGGHTQNGKNFESGNFNGTSGVWFDPSNGFLYAVTDTKKTSLMTYSWNQGRQRWDSRQSVHVKGIDTFGSPDFEDVVRLASGEFLFVSEGQKSLWIANPRGELTHSPLDGAGISQDHILSFSPLNETTFRRNRSFESLTLSKDRTSKVFFTLEQAPIQGVQLLDSKSVPLFQMSLGTDSRGRIKIEKPIVVGYIPLSADVLKLGTGGIAAIANVNDQEFWILERAWDEQNKNVVGRIFSIDLKKRSNKNPDTFERHTVLEFKKLASMLQPGMKVDNLEGMTFGPSLNGKSTLILASDNNENPTQTGQLLTLNFRAKK